MFLRGDLHGLRDICVRATCAKGQKRFRQSFSVEAVNQPEHILGYHITNHSYVATPERHQVIITGQYDIHVWYVFDRGGQTFVEKKTVCYTEYLPVIDLDGIRLGVDESVKCSLVKEPRIHDVQIRRQTLEAQVSVEFYAEIVGDTKLWVRVCEPPDMDDEKKDDGLEFDDEFDEFVDNEEDDEEFVEEF